MEKIPANITKGKQRLKMKHRKISSVKIHNLMYKNQEPIEYDLLQWLNAISSLL